MSFFFIIFFTHNTLEYSRKLAYTQIQFMAMILVYLLVFFALYFQVFLLVTFFEKRGSIKREESELFSLKRYPSTTIIVPCWNEERTVVKTIRSLLALEYPKHKLNIFIVDDGSTDNTWNIVKRFEKYPQIKLLQKQNGGKHTALNYALANIKTELVGCLDADSFVERDTLKKIVKYFEEHDVMAVIPSIKLYKPTRILELVQNVEYTIVIFFKKMLGTIDAIQVTPGPFSIFRKKVFNDLGPYRKAHNTEDLEIALRMHESHYRIVNSHKAFVTTVAPKTLKNLYKQRLRWAHGLLENALDYKHLFFNKKYGNFGMLVLPTGIISVFAALYIASYILINLGNYIVNKFIEIKEVGVIPSLSFDPFFFNTGTLLFLSIIFIGMIIFMILTGKRIAENTRISSIDIIYFMFIYGIIVPSWLFMAVYNTAFSRKTSWR